MTLVLGVYADGKKAPLVIIGRSKRPKSFPRGFDPVQDLDIYYFNKNAWNTHVLLGKQCDNLDKYAQVQSRKLLHLVGNCSAHSIDYSKHENISTHFLPPNTTSPLQPVDSSIGRSFKASYRRLLESHILKYINLELERPIEQRKQFKINEAVTTYDVVKMMSISWDMMSTSAVLSGWR